MKKTEKLVSKIVEKKPSRVYIQVPEGLKTRAKEIQALLDKHGVVALVSLDPCYGACDIKDKDAEEMGCDLLVHLGHTEFCPSERIETIYFPWQYHDIDPVPSLKEGLKEIEGHERIGLVASVNFLPVLEKVRGFLESEGFKVFVGSGKATREGQVLGCDVSAAKEIEEDVDCFVFIGSGEFHPLGLALESQKTAYRLDLEEGKLVELDFDRFLRQRIVAVEEAKESEVFGIVVSTKKGQLSPEVAVDIKNKLEEVGKEGYVFVMDCITPDKLQGIDLDCIINTACPRIAIEHRNAFDVPVVNLSEFEEIFDSWKSE